MRFLFYFNMQYFVLVFRPFHTDCENLARWPFLIETIDLYRVILSRCNHSKSEKARIFLFQLVCRFSLSLRNETGHPIRFELRSRAWRCSCCTQLWEFAHLSRVSKRAGKITLDPSHLAHPLFELLPSGWRYRALSTRTARHRNGFFPQAIHLINTSQ